MRERLLAAAAAQFAERGYGGTTVEAIARRAGVSKESFYRCFEDREGCYLALCDDLAAELERRIERAWGGGPDPWQERVAAAVRALFELAAERPEAMRAWLGEPLTAGRAAVERYEAVLDRFASCLRQGRRLNPRGEELPDPLERTLTGGVAWMLSQALAAGGDLGELQGEALRFLLTPYLES